MELRPRLPYGYKAFSSQGRYNTVLLDRDIDAYNAVQDEINRFIAAGMPPTDEMLNRSAFMFNSAVLNAQYRKGKK